MTSPDKNSVCIIGGGIAGLAAGVFCDSYGMKVTLLEKRPILGGRTYAFHDKKTDTWVDNGQHLMMGAYHETLRYLSLVGATHYLSAQDKTEVPLFTETGELDFFRPSSLPPPFSFLTGLLRMKTFSFSEKFSFLKLGKELKKVKAGKPALTLDQPCLSWLTALGQNTRVITNFWEPLILATLNEAPDKVSARMLAVVLTKGFLGTQRDAQLLFPKSHLTDVIVNPGRAYLEIRGHRLRTATQVRKIHILDNKIQAVELEDGELIRSEHYISAVPFSALLRLIPEGFFASEPYFENIRRLEFSPIISLNFWFDRDVLPHRFVGTAAKSVHWYFNRNRITGHAHPPYHVMGVISGAQKFLESSREEVTKMALDEFYSLYPQAKEATLIHSLVNKEREATLTPTVESESFRPAQKSPFQNFWVIGDWTKTGLPATIESAVVSARLATDAIGLGTGLSDTPEAPKILLPLG